MNFMAAIGPDFKNGVTDETLAANADVWLFSDDASGRPARTPFQSVTLEDSRPAGGGGPLSI
jgi:hypothetical protein